VRTMIPHLGSLHQGNSHINVKHTHGQYPVE
jgi:hypothetical protein